MTISQALDMHSVMEALAQSRPVFYSESDFKHALSWQIQQEHPSVRIRQEVGNLIEGPDRRYVDIWLPDSGTAIELKYLTRTAVISQDNEEFRLRDQSAQDLGRYGFCLDIARLEGIIRSGRGREGHAILLTNDHLYWNPPNKPDGNDADFVLLQDREISGTLSWGPRTSASTLKGRETPLEIRGRYRADWQEYSNPPGSGSTRFRYLVPRPAIFDK